MFFTPQNRLDTYIHIIYIHVNRVQRMAQLGLSLVFVKIASRFAIVDLSDVQALSASRANPQETVCREPVRSSEYMAHSNKLLWIDWLVKAAVSAVSLTALGQ